MIDPALDESMHRAPGRGAAIRAFSRPTTRSTRSTSRRATCRRRVERLDAPYLPLVVLEAAGVPLDPSFAEQKHILQRCSGLFYRCHGGAEARRFNRLLIDAGLIKGL